MSIPFSFSLTFLLVTCLSLSAQPPHPPQGMGPHGPGPFEILMNLDLTETQQKAVHTILEKHRAVQMATRQAFATKEKALRDAALDPATTEILLRTLHTEASEAHLQTLLDEHATILEIQALLTPEQQAKGKDLREKLQKEQEALHATMETLGAGPEGPSASPIHRRPFRLSERRLHFD